ncbi:hypothetical protein AOG1_06810 [Geobacter sp. AOG1]|nr:hypothetical protein AOG1_06810 [Geobacter sp. AOG1]
MQVLLFLVIGLVNFAWLAMCGMFHVGMFVLFLLVVIGAALNRK